MDDAEQRARAAIDRAHEADPEREDGRAAELAYAGRIERWLARLAPTPSPALRLAARAQHLERWAIPRASFPLDRAGYHRWRRAVHARQGERARELLLGAGCARDLADRVAALVAKAAAPDDAEAQALEDAACLEFLERELAAFAAQHQDYGREKFVDILRRTAAKMSPRARELALALPLSDALAALLREAVAPR
jgi:tRNAThr (cytosine32-N3)-methyltransferase